MLKLLLFFIALVIFDFFENLIRFIKCNKLINRIKSSQNTNDLVEYRQSFLNLTYFVHDKVFVKTIHTDFSPPTLKTTNTRAEFPFFDTEITAVHMLQESKGFYKNKMWDAINPIQWIRKFISIPSNVLTYLGVSTSNIFPKLLNVLWRIVLVIWWFLTPFAESYRAVLIQWTESLFN